MLKKGFELEVIAAAFFCEVCGVSALRRRCNMFESSCDVACVP